jgi:hypothetical protein
MYTRKGLTLVVPIVLFKLDWREGGKDLLLNWEMDTAFCRAEDEPRWPKSNRPGFKFYLSV